MNFNLHKIIRSILPLAVLCLHACGGGGGTTTQSSSVAPQTYTISGTVSGLVGTVVLNNNSVDNLTVTTNGNFIFTFPVKDGNPYVITVRIQPSGQTCSVSTGAGTVSGSNISNVIVVCATNTYSVGGTVSGLVGSVVLQNNNGDNLSVSANVFSFTTPLADSSPYSVTVLTHPAGQTCIVKNGSGTISAGPVSNVAVNCLNRMGGGMQGAALNLSKVVSTYAGASPGADGIGAAARFNALGASVSDGTNLYAVDTGNHTIRKIVIATGAVTTLAGQAGVIGAADDIGSAARFYTPRGITMDIAKTTLYVADTNNHKIRQIIIASGAVSSATGTSGVASTPGALDGAAGTATFNYPYSITADSTNLYVADANNHKIRQIIISSKLVSSVTGVTNTASTLGVADGAGGTAKFNYPYSIATDGINLYVADTNNHKIRQIVISSKLVSSVTGAVNTVSTPGALDGVGGTAAFNYPYSITTDGTNLYVADKDNHKIRQIVIADGTVSSVTGAANTASTPGALDGSGAAATFAYPDGIATDGANLYVADLNNNTLRQIVLSDHQVSTLAGPKPGSDGTGAAAAFLYPVHITTDGTNLYVADTSNNTIRKIVITSGAVTTLAGQAGVAGAADGTGINATFNSPQGITTDGTNLYVVDTYNHKIRQIVIASGVVSSVTGAANATSTLGAQDGPAATARFFYPDGITTDAINLYVTDSNNNKIRQIVIAGGAVSSMTGAANVASMAGSLDGAGSSATFRYPKGITTDGSNLYVADNQNHTLRQINIASRAVTTLAGSGAAGATDGSSTNAVFNYPCDLTTDGTNLYVTDASNNKIRQVVIATKQVSSMTGTTNVVGMPGALDGAGGTATFNYPCGITADGTSLYVVDSNNHSIRKIQ